MKTSTRASVRLSAQHTRRIDEAISKSGQTRSELVLKAVERFLADPGPQQSSAARLAQITEFMQIVADLIVNRDMPEKRDAILATVAKRVEQYHGGW